MANNTRISLAQGVDLAIAELRKTRERLARGVGPLGRLLGLADWSGVDDKELLSGVRARLDAVVDDLLAIGTPGPGPSTPIWGVLDSVYSELFEPTVTSPPSWLLRERADRALVLLSRLLETLRSVSPIRLAAPPSAGETDDDEGTPLPWAFPRLQVAK